MTGQAVAVLGTGLMGAGMATSLLRAGLDVRVWNRTAEKAQPLAESGATVCAEPASAVAGAHVVVTMLFDGDAVHEVMADALPAMATDAIWMQAATVGLDATIELARTAERAGVQFVDAPVLGTRKPAEEGKLIVLAAGQEQVRAGLAPVLDAIGSRTIWVGEQAGDGHRLKLVANSWVLSLVGATAQAIAASSGLGLDPRLFLETISGGPTDCAYAQLKGTAMIDDEFSPAFSLDGAVKDSGLIAAGWSEAGVDSALMDALHRAFERAADGGHGDEDMAAVVRAFAPLPAGR